jgi:predicted ABC-type ATPase
VNPILWIVAGPNGAGKTTLVSREPVASILPKVAFWNPDDLAKKLLGERGYTGFAEAPADQLRSAFIDAANATFANLKDCIAYGIPCGVETVLSTNKYQELVETVLAARGIFGLLYVGLRSPEIACRRVARRVLEKGHGVPEDKIFARWSRSLENLPWFAARASPFFIFDNSADDPNASGKLIAEGNAGAIRWHDASAIPELPAALKSLTQICE